jgi:hypothetical protein
MSISLAARHTCTSAISSAGTGACRWAAQAGASHLATAGADPVAELLTAAAPQDLTGARFLPELRPQAQ